jgi:hypothetical protein
MPLEITDAKYSFGNVFYAFQMFLVHDAYEDAAGSSALCS